MYYRILQRILKGLFAKKSAQGGTEGKKTLFFSKEKAYNSFVPCRLVDAAGPIFFVWNALSVDIVRKKSDFIAKDG